MKRAMPNIDDDDPDYLADDPNERVEIKTLNAIAGGDYWQEIALGSLPFHVKNTKLAISVTITSTQFADNDTPDAISHRLQSQVFQATTASNDHIILC